MRNIGTVVCGLFAAIFWLFAAHICYREPKLKKLSIIFATAFTAATLILVS